MKSSRNKSFSEAIIITKILDDGTLLVVDSKTTVRYLDLNSLETTSGFKANIVHERIKTNVVSFSSCGNYFVSMSANCKSSILYNSKTKKSLAKVDRHQGEVSCVGIEPKNRFMFSCGDDGKIFAIDIKSGKLAFTLPTHADTVNDIAFSDNGQWAATASYDKKISVFNLAMMTPKDKMKFHAAPVMKLLFLDKHRLVSADKRSGVIISNMYTQKVLARLSGIHDDITQMIKCDDDKFLFLGTQLGYVMVYELDTYQQIARSYIKLKHSITSLGFNKDAHELIIGTQSGSLLFFPIYKGIDKLKVALQKKDYVAAEEFARTNPILAYTKAYAMLDRIWEKTVEQARAFLENGKKDEAVKLFETFKGVTSKNNLIQKILKDYDEFDKFAFFVSQNKLPLAYSLANQKPVFKKSKKYKALEARWKKAFALAQKYSLEARGIDKAKEILSPYRGISEKTKLIQDMFTQGRIYKMFRASLAKKDYKMAFELAKQNEFLKEFAEYEALSNYGDNLYIKSQQLIQNGNASSALKLLRVLVDFSDFSQEARELIKKIENKANFMQAVKDNDMDTAYNILDLSDELDESDDGIEIRKQWDTDLELANAYASEGNTSGAKDVLEKYFEINSKHMSIATVFAWCYMSQLEDALRGKVDNQTIENGIKNYMINFGEQDQLVSFFEKYKKVNPESSLDLEVLTKGSQRMWKPSMIVNSILA